MTDLYLESMQPGITAVRNQTAMPVPRLNVVNGDAVAQWVELKKAYVELRGWRPDKNGNAIPKTTHHDVMQIATAWTKELKKVKPRTEKERSANAHWQACAAKVAALYDKAHPNAEFPENEQFWQVCTAALAIYLRSRKVVPSKWQLFTTALAKTLAEVPHALGDATRATAGAAAGLVKEPAKLAAVLLGAAILLPPVLRAFR